MIEDVLSDDPPRYVIRWDSGRETVMAPLPGAIRVEPTKRQGCGDAERQGANERSQVGRRRARLQAGREDVGAEAEAFLISSGSGSCPLRGWSARSPG